jgi:isopentenyl phosphate kinase
MIVVKLGGSVITDKDDDKTLKPEVLAGLAGALSDIDEEMAIVHGAGSFGHPLAKRSGVGSSPHVPERSADVARISADVRELNLHVIEALLDAGLRPLSVPPSAVCVARNGEISSFSGQVVAEWRAAGLTPVTFGDVVPDETMGVSIVSGDQLMMALAREMDARLAIFVSDVDGVFDRPPSEEGAILISDVDPGTRLTLGRVVEDVTGALDGKLAWMFRMAGMGVETWMVNGLVPKRLPELVSEGATVGSRILQEGGVDE